MKSSSAVRVGVRELKNRLASYLRLAKEDREVIITERGRPIAVIQSIRAGTKSNSLQTRIAALAAQGEVAAPERPLRGRLHKVKVGGRPLSEQIVADRR